MRVIGLEPTHLTAPDPKSGVSTNFTTPAGDERFAVQIYASFSNKKYFLDKNNLKIYNILTYSKIYFNGICDRLQILVG